MDVADLKEQRLTKMFEPGSFCRLAKDDHYEFSRSRKSTHYYLYVFHNKGLHAKDHKLALQFFFAQHFALACQNEKAPLGGLMKAWWCSIAVLLLSGNHPQS